MSENSEDSTPPFVQQRDLLARIATLMSPGGKGDWERVRLTRRALSMYAQTEMSITIDGNEEHSMQVPWGIPEPLSELRRIMYRPGLGTWFTAEFILDNKSGSDGDLQALFDYENEPDWGEPVAPATYALDLEDFPRDEEEIPDWLRARLAEAER